MQNLAAQARLTHGLGLSQHYAGAISDFSNVKLFKERVRRQESTCMALALINKQILMHMK